jgi:hypothetical protein
MGRMQITRQHFTNEEYTRPGLVGPRDYAITYHRGTIEDGAAIAAGMGASEQTLDYPHVCNLFPYHDRTYYARTAQGHLYVHIRLWHNDEAAA